LDLTLSAALNIKAGVEDGQSSAILATGFIWLDLALLSFGGRILTRRKPPNPYIAPKVKI
jgi:hypothetical protein